MAGNTRLSPDRLVKNVMGYDYSFLTIVPKPRQPPLKWGITNEGRARAQYLQILKDHHTNPTITECGLVVHTEVHYIRASPDGIVECACHDRRLLEIKCPYLARHMTPTEAIEKGKIDYVRKDECGAYQLVSHKRGYLHQIQTTMAVCNLTRRHSPC